MVATASTEHSYWLALAFVARNFHATNATQAIAFEWKPRLEGALWSWSAVGVPTGENANCGNDVPLRNRLSVRAAFPTVPIQINP